MLLCLYTLLSTAMLPLPDSHALGSCLHPGKEHISPLSQAWLSFSSQSPLAGPLLEFGPGEHGTAPSRQVDM